MSVHPVLPPVALTVLFVVFLGARVLVLRRSSGPSRSGPAWWRWAGVTAAGVLLFLAALRPALGGTEAPVPAGDGAPNIFVVLDNSPGMAAPMGADRSRMAVARADIDALIDRYPDARFAVIEFAAQPARRWPLSADTWSLRPVLDAVRPQPATPENVARTNAGAAGTMLRYQLISAGQQYPRADNLVFYLGAGAPESEVPQREFVLSGTTVDGGAVLGYGDAAAEPMLRAVADQIGVAYQARSAAAPLEEVLPPDGVDDDSGPMVRAAERTELYWIPAAAAAVLLLIELYLVLLTLRTHLRKSGAP